MCFHFLYNFCLKHLSFYEELSEIRSRVILVINQLNAQNLIL